MKQKSQMNGSIICNEIIFFIIMFMVLSIVPISSARENADNIAFTGMNGISNKSSTMFYNDNNSGNGKLPALFTAAAGRKLADGIELTAAGSQYPVKLIPITLSQGMGRRNGNRITYEAAPGVHIIYAFKKNGIKEDIVFDHSPAAPLDIVFRMELDPMLQARLDGKGNVLIYGPNSILSGFIQTGDEKSAELVLKARRQAPRDNLLYIIPAPVVIDGMGKKHKNLARYSLDKSILTVHADRLANLLAPVSIDPSIVVTTTADFMTGNNEGMISFDTNAISRAVPSGGSIANWTATTNFTVARNFHTSVAYDGYLYVIGGWDGASYFSDVQFAPINADGTVGSWTATSSLPAGRNGHTSVAYNGYLYVLGGYDNVPRIVNDVQFAPINANGTVGVWTATTSFTTTRYGHTSVAYNGYLYVIGGWSGDSYLNDVQYAPINANGTVGAWTATASFTTARENHTSVAYNGYLYVIGGYASGNTYLNDVQYAPINANGIIGAWSATTSFTLARGFHTSVGYNGYLYVIGGNSGMFLEDIQFALINANGTVGAWSATTGLTTARFGHTSVGYNGYLYVLGGRSSFSFLNDVQFAPINASGSVGAWTATTSLPTACYGHTSVAYNGYLYVLGGYNGISDLNDVQFASINANGTIGAWTATTSFTTARESHTSVVYNGYLYVLGGYDNVSGIVNDVQFAPINANGTVGAWTVTTSFPMARYSHTSVAYNGYLYVMGGSNGSSNFNDVRYAPINANGTIGAWTLTSSFPGARYGHTSVAYNGYLYVIGGNNGSSNFNDVQYAPINADGTVGLWYPTTLFTTARYGHTSVAYNGYLYVIGGISGLFLNDVQYASINGNGTLGAWKAAASFTTARGSHTSAAYNGYFYVIGGFNGSCLNDVQYAPVNGNRAVGVGAWTATTSFTTARRYHTSVAYNGYLYVIGGYGGSYLNDVQYAPINTNGTIGAWSATTSFITARSSHTSVIYNGYLYVIGGYSGSSNLNDVQFAAINSDGTVDSWTATTGFTTARRNHTSVVYKGYLYVIGGDSGSPLNDVQFAPVNGNGTVGAWTATTSFTTARRIHTSVVYNGYLYVIGGTGNSGSLNDVQFAPINADGSVGTWTTTSSFLPARSGHTSVAYNGYLYIMGGYYFSGSGYWVNDVQFAPINANGTIGPWTATTSFITARAYHTSATYNGYLYVLGGYNGTSYFSDVQFTALSGSAARGRYSKLVDLGADQIITSFQFSDSGAEGITNLTYTVAPSSTAVFGSRTSIANALSGTLYTVGLNICGRYIWVNFDLDDTFSAIDGGGGLNGRGDLLDFTITYDLFAGVGASLRAGKSSPNVHLAWSASPGATSYNVLRCTAATIPCTPVTIASPSTNAYDDPVLADSSNYWYLIQAVNASCVSP